MIFLLESRAVVFILHIITFLMYHSLVWFYCERSAGGEWYLCASSLKIKRFNLNKLTNIMFFGAVYYKYVLLCLFYPGHITDSIRTAYAMNAHQSSYSTMNVYGCGVVWRPPSRCCQIRSVGWNPDLGKCTLSPNEIEIIHTKVAQII